MQSGDTTLLERGRDNEDTAAHVLKQKFVKVLKQQQMQIRLLKKEILKFKKDQAEENKQAEIEEFLLLDHLQTLSDAGLSRECEDNKNEVDNTPIFTIPSPTPQTARNVSRKHINIDNLYLKRPLLRTSKFDKNPKLRTMLLKTIVNQK